MHLIVTYYASPIAFNIYQNFFDFISTITFTIRYRNRFTLIIICSLFECFYKVCIAL